MATFSSMQTRVLSWLIDTPSAVQTEVPTLLTASIAWLQAQHNFQVMQAEAQYVTSSTPALGTSQTHIIGQIPSDWKCKRGDPYYVMYIGNKRRMHWQPEREYMYRKWEPFDINQVGQPKDLLIGEPENAQYPPAGGSPSNSLTGLNIECFPFPDGSSDYSDGNYRINIPYYRYLPALAAPTDTNWFCLDGPQAEFCVSNAIWQGFMMNEDEQRASAHKVRALGSAYDGSHEQTLGGWARTVIDMDKGIMSMPARSLSVRRDVFGSKDQYRQ
jgi:hypothetical protein